MKTETITWLDCKHYFPRPGITVIVSVPNEDGTLDSMLAHYDGYRWQINGASFVPLYWTHFPDGPDIPISMVDAQKQRP